MDYGSPYITLRAVPRGVPRGEAMGRAGGEAGRRDFLFAFWSRPTQQAVLQHQDRQRVVHSPPQADALWSGPWDAFDDAACLEVDLCGAHNWSTDLWEEADVQQVAHWQHHNCLQPHSLRPSSSEHTQYMLFQHFVLTLVHGPAVETAGAGVALNTSARPLAFSDSASFRHAALGTGPQCSSRSNVVTGGARCFRRSFVSRAHGCAGASAALRFAVGMRSPWTVARQLPG